MSGLSHTGNDKSLFGEPDLATKPRSLLRGDRSRTRSGDRHAHGNNRHPAPGAATLDLAAEVLTMDYDAQAGIDCALAERISEEGGLPFAGEHGPGDSRALRSGGVRHLPHIDAGVVPFDPHSGE